MNLSDLIGVEFGLYAQRQQPIIFQDAQRFLGLGNPETYTVDGEGVIERRRRRIEGGRASAGVTSGGGSIPSQDQYVNGGMRWGSPGAAGVPQVPLSAYVPGKPKGALSDAASAAAGVAQSGCPGCSGGMLNQQTVETHGNGTNGNGTDGGNGHTSGTQTQTGGTNCQHPPCTTPTSTGGLVY